MSLVLEVGERIKVFEQQISRFLPNPIFDTHVHLHPINPYSIDEDTKRLKIYKKLEELKKISDKYNVEKFGLIITPSEDKYREKIEKSIPGSYLGLYIRPWIIEEYKDNEREITELLAYYDFIKLVDEDFYYYISSDELLKLFEDYKGNIPKIIQIHTTPSFLEHNEYRNFMNLLMSKYGIKIHFVHGVYALRELESEKAKDIVKWIKEEKENIVLGTSNFVPLIELATHPTGEILGKYELEDNVVFESGLYFGIKDWEGWFIDSLKSVLKGIKRPRRKKLDERELIRLIFFKNAEKFYSR